MTPLPSDPRPAAILGIFVIVTVIISTDAQLCARTDGSISSTLSLAVDEADQSPSASDPRFRSQIPIYIGGSNGLINQVQISISSTGTYNPNNQFIVQEVNGDGFAYLRLVNAIDRDGNVPLPPDPINSLTFQLSCQTRNSTPIVTTNYTVVVTVRDVNDNYPVFNNIPNVLLNVPEQAAIPRFSIEEATGILRISERLQYEKQNFFPLTIEARDNGSPRLSVSGFLNITVLDQNTLRPGFFYSGCATVPSDPFFCIDPQYIAAILGSQTGITVGVSPVIIAKDRDLGVQDPIQFFIDRTEPTMFQNYFTVTTNGPDASGYYSPAITLVQPILRTLLPNGQVKIILRASEVNIMEYFEYATLTVNVLSVNQYAPNISTNFYIVQIPENAARNTYLQTSSGQLAALTVTDNDLLYTDPYPGYAFATSNPAFSVVTQGTLNFVTLIQENYLDYETNPQFQLQVFATEVNTTERRTGTITLTVNIMDANDNSTVFPGVVCASSVSTGFYISSSPIVYHMLAYMLASMLSLLILN